MKKFIPFFLAFVFTIGFIIPSCNIYDDSDCNCPPITGEYFRILDLSLGNQTLNGTPLTANETAALNDYVLKINIDPEFYSHNKQVTNAKETWPESDKYSLQDP